MNPIKYKLDKENVHVGDLFVRKDKLFAYRVREISDVGIVVTEYHWSGIIDRERTIIGWEYNAFNVKYQLVKMTDEQFIECIKHWQYEIKCLANSKISGLDKYGELVTNYGQRNEESETH